MPQGLRERIAANLMATNGERWSHSRTAQARLQAWTLDYLRRRGFTDHPSVILAQAYAECRQEAINAGALKPQGWKERIAANLISSNGGSWSDSVTARSRLEAWTNDCMRRRGFSV